MSPDALVRSVLPEDLPAIFDLHARVFGPGRFTRTAYRVREGTPPISRYCIKAMLGNELVAAIRYTPVTIGGRGGALLLGPLAVEPEYAGQGYGKGLVAVSLERAKADGVELVTLVGDEAYYGRFGFFRVPLGQITLPGPVDPSRMLAAELQPGALPHFRGVMAAERT